MHFWDWCIADRWVPELSFGFATLTKYPDAHPETNTVDGPAAQAYGDTEGVAWSTLIADAGSWVNDTAADESFMYIQSDSVTDKWRNITRSIFSFDTSALTDEAVKSAAVLSLFGSYKNDALGSSPTLNIYTSNPASNTSLVAGDFDSFGSVAQCDTPMAYASFSISGYNDFAFNSTGRGNISKTGISKFGGRNANYDVAASAPTWGATLSSEMNGYYADQTGTANDPKLVVTYTLPDSTRVGRIILEQRSDGTIGG
jgi:hypothetical protein